MPSPSKVSEAKIEMRMVISGAKFLSLYDGDRNLAKRRIWTCIRTTGKLTPKKPVQKTIMPRATFWSDSGYLLNRISKPNLDEDLTS